MAADPDERSSALPGRSSAAEGPSSEAVGCSSGADERSFRTDGGSFGPSKRLKGFTGNRFAAIAEPLPAAGTAEIWSLVVQYQYQDAPFGQMSQPVTITVRG